MPFVPQMLWDAMGVRHLRTHLSWADYRSAGGEAWYDWLLPTLGNRFDLLPCLHYTPPDLSETGRTSGPPRDLRLLADFVDHIIDRYGAVFTWLELWNEPNNLLDWDWRHDQDWLKFSEMLGCRRLLGRSGAASVSYYRRVVLQISIGSA